MGMGAIKFEDGWQPLGDKHPKGQYWFWVEVQLFDGDEDGRGGYTQEYIGSKHELMVGYLDEVNPDEPCAGLVQMAPAVDLSDLRYLDACLIRAIKPFEPVSPPQ